MKLRVLFAAASLCLSMIAHAASAQPLQPLDYEPEWLQQMYAQGWQKVEEGVLQRGAEEGQVETFSYGAEGLRWAIERYELEISSLEKRYSESPDAKLAELIQSLRDRVESLNGQVLTAPSAEEFDSKVLEGCSSSFDATVSAGPRESPRGVKAEAHASWWNDCGYVGSIYAYAYAHAVEGTEERTYNVYDPKTGDWIDSHVIATAEGSLGCQSEATAEVSVPALNILYKRVAEPNSSCPASVSVAVTGPSVVTSDSYGDACADVTWTASTTGGTPPYTIYWYSGYGLQGTGSTLTKRYCDTDETVTVRAYVMDANGWTDDETFTTEIGQVPHVVASLSGPAAVTTDYYTSACANVTWTASATGGHPGGYTYDWYLGTDPAVQGTGSTFTKNYCNTNQNVAVKVVARDSDGHTDDETFSTVLQHIGPVVASANGPASVTTDYYTSSGCANVTWTASATGGHAGGYTYSWYLGTDATVQGTGSTFTKSYCNIAGNVTAKVVARDSDGHTAEASRATSVVNLGRIVARITGPTSVDLTTAAPCADVTWTASATGNGHSGFTYQWYFGTVLQGTGTSLTKRYCSAQTVSVKLVATASDGHTDQDTHSTTINPIPVLAASITGSTSVALATSTECKSLTWTASATGGSGGYTYSWTIGASTTVQGTAATLTKSYCGPQTINVKVAVRDSAAQTVNATHATTLTYSPPLTASVTGPGFAASQLSSPTECKSLTWTASATGGTPGYTYKWYIGTSTTIQGTASTLTKTYCGEQTINVKAVVQDAGGKTAEATRATTLIVVEPDPCATWTNPREICNVR